MGEIIDGLPNYGELLSNVEATKFLFAFIFREKDINLNTFILDGYHFPSILNNGSKNVDSAYYDWGANKGPEYYTKISSHKKIVVKIKDLIYKLFDSIVSYHDIYSLDRDQLLLSYQSYFARYPLLVSIRDEMKQAIHEAKEEFNEFITEEIIDNFRYKDRNSYMEEDFDIKGVGWCANQTCKSLKKFILDMEEFAKQSTCSIDNISNEALEHMFEFYNKLNNINNIDPDDLLKLKVNMSKIYVNAFNLMEISASKETFQKFSRANHVFVSNEDPIYAINYNFFDSYYHQHENDEIGTEMQIFIEDLAEIKDCVSGSIFKKIIEYERNNSDPIPPDLKMFYCDIGHYGFFVNDYIDLPKKKFIFIDQVPIKLRSSTDKRLVTLLQFSIYLVCDLGSGRSNNCNYLERNKIMTQEIDNISFKKLPDETSTLDEQKIWACVFAYNEEGNKQNWQNLYNIFPFIASTLPWYIDDDSKEAKELENELREFCQFYTKYHGMGLVDSNREYVNKIKMWVTFAMDNIWDATEPLDFAVLKSQFESIPPQESDGCCNIQ